MKFSRTLQQAGLLAMAIVFSVALMFAFIELPKLFDVLLQDRIDFPGLDHGSSNVSAYKTELYISALHLRWIGYGSLILVALFIILGFTTRRSSWAWAGAFVIFLPVFGQFAMSMFFLAGLGMLRIVWMPFWDISFNLLDLGNVVMVPYWILMWVFRQFDIWAQPILGWVFMSVGAFLFTWGVLVWMQSRFSRQKVATSWIYRFSRHPQYLGWIIWTYGLIIYTPLINQMKKSWGVSSTFPWLLMTMIIICICMLEEISMKKKYGDTYDSFREKTPFLFPIPGFLFKIFRFPMWLIVGRRRPGRKREVVAIVTLYTIIFMGISLFWVDAGQRRIIPINNIQGKVKIKALVEKINASTIRGARWHYFGELARYGDAAVPVLLAFLSDDNPENIEFAASKLGPAGDTSAIKPLHALLNHPWENVRLNAVRSLAQLGDSSLVPVVLEMLPFEKSAYAHSLIYDVLGDFRAEEAWIYLAEASTTEDPWVRMAAVRAMAKIDPGRTVPYLIPLFSVESDWVRSDAATLAHVLRDERTLPHLEKMLTDKNYEVRFLAAEAIKSIERK